MLRLTSFGGLALDRDGDPITSGAGAQRRPLALLAQLAVAGERGLSRAKLVALLWPESDEERARRVLAQTLYSLRRDLCADELLLGNTELRLNPAVIATDVFDFLSALSRGANAEAVALYRGPFLDGFYLPGAAEFERWVEETRSALAQRHIMALKKLASESAAGGDARAEAEWWRKLATVDPLSSRYAVGLMRALAAAGDRAGALQHARIHEALVREELGAEPASEFFALVEQLKGRTAEHEIAGTGVRVTGTGSGMQEVQSGRDPAAAVIRHPQSEMARRPILGLAVVLAAIAVLTAVSFSRPDVPDAPRVPDASRPDSSCVRARIELANVYLAAGRSTDAIETLRSAGTVCSSSARRLAPSRTNTAPRRDGDSSEQ